MLRGVHGVAGGSLAQLARMLACARVRSEADRAAYRAALRESRQEVAWLADEARRRHRTPARAPVTGEAHALLEHMVARAAQDEPLSYIIGHQPFGPLHLQVRAPVLVPRPETEAWSMRLGAMVDAAVRAREEEPRTKVADAPFRVLDLCTGTGCIALVLAHHLREAFAGPARPPWRVTAVDSDADAIALASENMRDHGWEHTGHVRVVRADMFADADEELFLGYDLVVVNPPYVRAAEWDTLDRSVRAYESRGALVGSAACPHDDGLVYYRRLRSLMDRGMCRARVRRGLPAVVVEVGARQARDVGNILRGGGRTEIWADDQEHERVVLVY
ncbi:hypothetical protein MSPP1_003245 [Malassezia sp. CBS 17886]|nr:hypothetical protein MSPP1_003245 [Malassezia sp. CBS 17886]